MNFIPEWSEKSKEDLTTIYNFYAEKSIKVANSILEEIIKSAEEVRFSDQYQNDEIQPEFRRIIVRHFKILYKIKGNRIRVYRLFDTRQDPSKQGT